MENPVPSVAKPNLFPVALQACGLTEYVCIAPNEAKRTETKRGALHPNDRPGRRTTIRTRMRIEMARSVSPTPYLSVRIVSSGKVRVSYQANEMMGPIVGRGD